EDGIRDFHVTGVQTCALPICPVLRHVGDDVPRAACGLELVEDLVEVAAVARPAPRGERAAAHVETDRDLVAVVRDDLSGPLRIQIGRASCRERASVSVVAAAL